MRDTFVSRALCRVADLAFLGAVLAVLVIPVVTAPAALAALGAASPRNGWAAALRSTWHRFRERLAAGAMAGLVLAAVAGAGVMLSLAADPSAGLAGAYACAVGVVLVLGAAYATPYAAASLTAPTFAARARAAWRLAALDPLSGLAYSGSIAVVLVVAAVFPVAALPMAGILPRLTVSIPRRVAARIECIASR